MSKVLAFIAPPAEDEDTFIAETTRERYDYDSMIVTFAQSDELLRDHVLVEGQNAGYITKKLNEKASELRQTVKAMAGTRTFQDGTTSKIVRLTKNV